MFKIFPFFTSSHAPLPSSVASSLQKFSLNTTGQQCGTVSHRQHWFTPSASLKETGTRQLMTTVSVLQGACSNVITVIQKFQDSLFVCGTNGNKPRCWKLVSVCACLGWCLMFVGPPKGAVFLEIAVIVWCFLLSKEQGIVAVSVLATTPAFLTSQLKLLFIVQLCFPPLFYLSMSPLLWQQLN